jgi:hypothetical protein
MQVEGWCWTTCGSGIELTGQRLVATNVNVNATGFVQLVTGSLPMTEGRHYWEVEINVGTFGTMVGATRPGMDHDEAPDNDSDTYVINKEKGSCGVMVGAARPGVDHDAFQDPGSDMYCVGGYSGGLFGNGKRNVDPQGELLQGDRVGVLLDLDAGWMRFYRNGKRFGPGYTSGVTGPLVRAAVLSGKGDTVTVLPGATAPEGADADARGAQLCNAQNEQGAVLAPKDARTCVPCPCSALHCL